MNPGRILTVLLLAVGLIGSLVNGGVIYSRILYMGLLLIIFTWLWAQLSILWIRVERQARSLRASVGDIFEERYEVINNGRLLSLWVRRKGVPYASARHRVPSATHSLQVRQTPLICGRDVCMKMGGQLT